MTKLSKTRLLFVFFFFLATLFVLLLRLAFIQIVQSKSLSSKQLNQSRVIIEMQPTRGRIFDRNGRELALDLRLDSVYAVSREIKGKAKVTDAICRALGVDRAEISSRIQRDKLFVWIGRKLSASKSQALRKLKLEGIGFVKESQRVYPKGETACHLVGFTGIDNDGLEGIELYYNSYLKGVPGWKLAQRDAKLRELISKEIEMVPPVDGYNIHLAIDEVIQALTEKALAETCKKYNALGGSIVVMDPITGDILAMAVYPLYDLNNARHSKPEVRRNRAITDLFEPGSVFKAITLAGILDSKIFSLNEKFNCEHGSWAVAGKVLHDHGSHGVMTFREIIEKSSNIGTVKGAMRLGASKLHKNIRGFGFGEKTGIGLAGEVNGLVPHPKNWSRSSIINIPIGQGIAVTPIQLATAFAAIANDGLLMKPRILTSIEDQDGKLIQNYPVESVRQVISKETALQVRSTLEGVVSRGTGKKAAVPGFKAAGKTGTAQKTLPNGTYSHDHFTASFVGFVPYDEPKLVIAVNLDEPHPVYYGGVVAAPAFAKVAIGTLAYWQIAPVETPKEVARVSSKTLKGKIRKETSKIMPKPVDAATIGLAGQ